MKNTFSYTSNRQSNLQSALNESSDEEDNIKSKEIFDKLGLWINLVIDIKFIKRKMEKCRL